MTHFIVWLVSLNSYITWHLFYLFFYFYVYKKYLSLFLSYYTPSLDLSFDVTFYIFFNSSRFSFILLNTLFFFVFIPLVHWISSVSNSPTFRNPFRIFFFFFFVCSSVRAVQSLFTAYVFRKFVFSYLKSYSHKCFFLSWKALFASDILLLITVLLWHLFIFRYVYYINS